MSVPEGSRTAASFSSHHVLIDNENRTNAMCNDCGGVFFLAGNRQKVYRWKRMKLIFLKPQLDKTNFL
ncbi:MAG: hypothetical protein R3Y27_08370 [Clostridia bacterium]